MTVQDSICRERGLTIGHIEPFPIPILVDILKIIRNVLRLHILLKLQTSTPKQLGIVVLRDASQPKKWSRTTQSGDQFPDTPHTGE